MQTSECCSKLWRMRRCLPAGAARLTSKEIECPACTHARGRHSWPNRFPASAVVAELAHATDRRAPKFMWIIQSEQLKVLHACRIVMTCRTPTRWAMCSSPGAMKRSLELGSDVCAECAVAGLLQARGTLPAAAAAAAQADPGAAPKQAPPLPETAVAGSAAGAVIAASYSSDADPEPSPNPMAEECEDGSAPSSGCCGRVGRRRRRYGSGQTGKSRAGSDITLRLLTDKKLVRPGEDVLSVAYKGGATNLANLAADGLTECKAHSRQLT